MVTLALGGTSIGSDAAGVGDLVLIAVVIAALVVLARGVWMITHR